MSLCEDIKSNFTLHEVAAMVGMELPQRAGIKFRSPLRTDLHPSCSVYRRGEDWRFKDWSQGTDVDLIDFYAIARGIDNTEAISELAQKLDSTATNDKTSQPFKPNLTAERIIRKPSPMPAAVANSWNKGLAHLQGNARTQQSIAEWRGWPVEIVIQLVEDGLLATPLYFGKRYIAFRVDWPETKDFGAFGHWFSTEQIGWHVRLKPSQAGERPQWRFNPSESEHGHGIPALPFIIGDFSTARLIVIVEGPWDAITFAHAAGWLSHDASFPDSICVLGIRGAQGINPFLRYYAPLWPAAKPKCLLLPDNDSAGATWFQSRDNKPSFAERLREYCADVRVKTIANAKDFDEAWKRGLVTRSDIGREFQSNGFIDEKGQLL